MAKDDDILEEARELFQQCEEREADNRDEALDDLEFARLARQWRARGRGAARRREAAVPDHQPHAGLHSPGGE